MHAVFDGVAGGQHQHVGRGVARTQAPQHFKAVDVGQSNIEDREIEIFGPEQQIRVPARAGLLHRMPGPGQRGRQSIR